MPRTIKAACFFTTTVRGTQVAGSVMNATMRIHAIHQVELQDIYTGRRQPSTLHSKADNWGSSPVTVHLQSGPMSRVCATKPHLVVIYNHRKSILIVDDKIDDLERLRGTFFEAGCAPKIEQSDNADKMKDWGRRTCSKETCCSIE